MTAAGRRDGGWSCAAQLGAGKHKVMLKVQQLAQQTAVDGLVVVKAGARGYADLVDQFRRALVSVTLNTTEGLARTGRDEQQFLRIARGSAQEASAALALLVAIGVVQATDAAKVESGLDQVRAMLWRLGHLAGR